MRYFNFSINISSLDFLPYYEGRVRDIVVTSDQGLRVQFPAMHLRPFLTRSGISGRFCLQTNQGKFVSLTKIS